jgi:hypothetical protein
MQAAAQHLFCRNTCVYEYATNHDGHSALSVISHTRTCEMSSNSHVIVRKLEVDDFGKGAVAFDTTQTVRLRTPRADVAVELGTGERRLPALTRTANDGRRCQSR